MNNDVLTRFAQGSKRNGWYYSKTMKVYVRKSWRLHPQTNVRIYTFDIANITIAEPGVGTFTKWYVDVKVAAKANGFDAVVVESVQNKQFASGLRKWGLIELADFGAPTFYQLL